MKAQDVPALPKGWRKSMERGGAHRKLGDWAAAVSVAHNGYGVIIWRRVSARTLEDAMAECDEWMESQK